jgi:hypothetical protein
MNLSPYSLNAIFERFLAAFRSQFVVYPLGMPLGMFSSFESKIRRNLIIKINGIGSYVFP